MLMLELFIVFICSLVLTGYIRHYAGSKHMIDLPNHRSSHSSPTPRGGGSAFVICFLIFVLLMTYFEIVQHSLGGVLVIAGGIMALLGFYDDRYHLPARIRLLIHFILCAVTVWFAGGMPPLVFFIWTIPSGFILSMLATLYLVWLLNLYNFMDGIDGIAGIEAVSVCIGAAVMYWSIGYSQLVYLPLGLAFSVAGFLFWNMPTAKIFMGDAGSNFLGFIFGVMSIYSACLNHSFFWGWLILLGVFIVDATTTLLFRAIKMHNLFEAHCDHAYQHASKRFSSHFLVSFAVLVINTVWLLPWALMVSLGYVNGVLGVLLAYTPLLLLALKFHAGKGLSTDSGNGGQCV